MTLNWSIGRFAAVAAFAGATAASMLFWQSALRTSVPPLALPHPSAGDAQGVVRAPLFDRTAPAPASAASSGQSILLGYQAVGQAVAAPARRDKTDGSRSLPARATPRKQPPTARTTPAPQAPATSTQPTAPGPVTVTPTATPVAVASTNPRSKPATRKLAMAHESGRARQQKLASPAHSMTHPPASPHSAYGTAAQPALRSQTPLPKKRDQEPTVAKPSHEAPPPNRAQPTKHAGGKPHPATPPQPEAPDATQETVAPSPSPSPATPPTPPAQPEQARGSSEHSPGGPPDRTGPPGKGPR